MAREGTGKLTGVRKIAVLRPNAVGDFVFTLPALHALKTAYPEAELVLLGLPWHAAFLAGRPGPVDRVLVVPPLPGIGLAPGAPDNGARHALVEALRMEDVDLACQMYGGGRYANPLVGAFHARVSIGARAEGAAPLDRWVRYTEPANRRLALLDIAALAGANALMLGLELALTEADRRAAARVLDEAPALSVLVRRDASGATTGTVHGAADAFRCGESGAAARAGQGTVRARASGGTPVATATGAACGTRHAPWPGGNAAPLVLLQPGSTDPRRCWPAESFAAVGDALAALGARIAVNGTAAEAPRVRAVIGAMRAPALDLSGKLDLGGLCGVIERAACIVSNDTGPLHLALAIGRPCVGIFWLTNLIEGMPLRPHLLRAALSLRQDCPVCALPNLHSRCAHDASFVADVPVEQVVALARDVLGQTHAGPG